MADFGIVIPARYASTRLPGKPLRLIAGRPMIEWVYQNARNTGAAFVWVATDDERIAQAVTEFGGEAIMTSPDHSTGTDRLAEVVHKRGVADDTIIVNVQGDEPLLAASYIQLVASELSARPHVGIATLASPIESVDDLMNENVVKVVLDHTGRACAFSRAPIPWVRGKFTKNQLDSLPEGVPFLRHIGLYAYRARALHQIAAHPAVEWESAESLEQLRALWMGISIHCVVVEEAPPHGVDTEEDLRKVEATVGGR